MNKPWYFVYFRTVFQHGFGAIHFVNQPWYIEAIFKLIKPFLKEKSKDRVRSILFYVIKETFSELIVHEILHVLTI